MADVLEVNKKLLEFYNTVENKYNVWFLALYGSQNYNLDTETSDIDTKALIIPSFKDLTENNGVVNNLILTPENEHIEVKDARGMIHNFWKQNINFLEILFTRHVIVNEKYYEEWKALTELREQIAHYDERTAANAMFGMAKQKQTFLCKSRPGNQEVVEKYGYDGKQLSNIMRLYNFLSNYINDCSFDFCLTYHHPICSEKIIAAKRQEYSLETAINLANETMSLMEELKNNYLNKLDYYHTIPSNSLYQKVNDIVYSVYEKAVREELNS